MAEKKKVSDPCYSEDNFRRLLDVLFTAYRASDGFERQLLGKIIFDGMIEVTPVELLCMLIHGGKQLESVDDVKDLWKYQRTPKAVYDSLDAKRGYILESVDSVKRLPVELRIRWKDVKSVLFLDKPEELADQVSMPIIGLIAKWRQNCYEEFVKTYNEGYDDCSNVG